MSPYIYTFQNPIKYIDPTGMEGEEGGEDWIKNKHGKYLYDKKATSQKTTRAGWKYVGKELPSDVDSRGQDILEEIGGNLYHKNTSNTLVETGNWINEALGGDSGYWGVEKKPYNQADENMVNELVSTAAGSIAGGVVVKGAGSVVGNSMKIEMTTVGRWMSKTEYGIMSKTGQIVEGARGQTFVGVGGAKTFTAAAKGSVYAEFQVPTNSLLQGGKANWFKVIGPNSGKAMQAQLQKQGGTIVTKNKKSYTYFTN